MFYSIQEVNDEFFKLFIGGFSVVDPRTGTSKTVVTRYAKKSSGDYAEEGAQQVYPCIAIDDFTPQLSADFRSPKFWNSYFGKSAKEDFSANIFKRPLQFEFRYDVSVVAKSYYEWVALRDKMIAKYVGEQQLLLKAKLTDEARVGEVVEVISVDSSDIPRNDGVFETNFEFRLNVWVAVSDAKEVSLIQEVILDADIMP